MSSLDLFRPSPERVGFSAPAEPPGPAKTPRKPILKLVQGFFQAPQKPLQAPQAAPEAMEPEVQPQMPSPQALTTSGPPAPRIIRIEASKEPGVWTFSTTPCPVGIEGMVRAAGRQEAIQRVEEALLGLSLLCNSEALLSMALLVDASSIQTSTRLTPDNKS